MKKELLHHYLRCRKATSQEVNMINLLTVILLVFLFFFVEIVIYTFFLVIKALKIYIRKNNDYNSAELTKSTKRKSKAGVIGIIVFNFIFVIFLVALPYVQRNYVIYNTENVINCNQKDADRFTKLLEVNNIEYKVLGRTKVKIQNEEDFNEAIRIVEDNGLSFSIVNVINR